MAKTKVFSMIRNAISWSTSVCAITIFSLCLSEVSGSDLSELLCARGWGSSSSISKQPIPKDWINDGYCDCPLEGIDEPETGACSGSVVGGWAGVVPVEVKPDPAYFYQCPYESHLLLPPSQINDGICDCCDGSDEKSSLSLCVDSCQELRAVEEARVEKVKVSFKDGSNKRQEEIEKYNEYMDNSVKDFNEILMDHVPKFERIVEEAEKAVKKAKNEYLFQRRNTMIELSHKLSMAGNDNNSIGLLEVFTDNEIIDLIVGVCQLSAESPDYDKGLAECEHFVKAGLELGIIYKDGSLQKVAQVDTEENEYEIIHVIDEISRLILDNGDDNEDGKQSENDEDYNYDDDFHHLVEQIKTQNLSDSEVEVKEDISPKSIIPRSHLQNVGLKLLHQISLFYDDIEDESDEDSKEDSEEKQAIAAQLEKIDPIALQKVKASLQRKLAQIKRGEKVAGTTREQLDFLIQNALVNSMDLMQIATAVIYHSSITSSDVVELLYHIIPEFSMEDDDKDICTNNVCRLDYPTVSRETSRSDSQVKVQVPPAPLLDKYAKRCQDRTDSIKISSNQCAQTDKLGPQQMIPDDIVDGYMNYFTYVKRDEDESDPLRKLFQSLVDISNDVTFKTYLKGLNSAQEELRYYQGERARLKIVVGGENQKYGPSGEFYALRDSCHSVISAKYEYEVCFNGNAYQREATGGKKTGGTSLGSWKGYEVRDDGHIILKFEGGQRCWNGPSRSATVILTCGGSGTKILSVEEPETCRYQMEMESYIACDENFAKRNGLAE